MNNKGFAETHTSIETPNDVHVAEKPLKTYKNRVKRVDINILKSKLQENESKEFNEPISMEVFYTPEISAQASQQFNKLKGLPLEYSVSTQGMIMKIKAKSITKEDCPKSLFEIPKEYEKMNLEEFQKMMGGK